MAWSVTRHTNGATITPDVGALYAHSERDTQPSALAVQTAQEGEILIESSNVQHSNQSRKSPWANLLGSKDSECRVVSANFLKFSWPISVKDPKCVCARGELLFSQ